MIQHKDEVYSQEAPPTASGPPQTEDKEEDG